MVLLTMARNRIQISGIPKGGFGVFKPPPPPPKSPPPHKNHNPNPPKTKKKKTGEKQKGVFGVSNPPPPPEIPKALQNRTKLNPIVKTVKNC